MASGITRRSILAAALVPAGAFLARAVAAADPADGDGWKSLFDGETLGGWKQTGFAAGGEVHVVKSFRDMGPALVLDAGERLSGFQWTREVPKTNYEIELEALKIKGNDFLLGLTFPVGDSHATLVMGGWGGGVVGISSIDNSDASENMTTKFLSFASDRWYHVHVRVTPKKIEAWLDRKPIIDQELDGHKISLRPGDISLQVPLGIATYQTSAAYRNIRMRPLKP